MESFCVKIVAADGNILFRSLAVLLEIVSCYFPLRCLIANTKKQLFCAEYIAGVAQSV
jgi:hypothetical protein